jgi:hypothetical protein
MNMSTVPSEHIIDTPPNLNLKHLEIELARLDVYLKRAVYCWQLAGQDPQDQYRGLYVSDQDSNAALERPAGFNWGNTISLTIEDQQSFTDAECASQTRLAEIKALAAQNNEVLRFEELSDLFKLDPIEKDILLVCLAPSLDLRYEKIYGYLQDDVTRRRPTVNLILDLFGQTGLKKLELLQKFRPISVLFEQCLVEFSGDTIHQPLLNRFINLDNTLVNWLVNGHYVPEPELQALVKVEDPYPTEFGKLAAGSQVEKIKQGIIHQPIMILSGNDLAAQQAAAKLLAAELKQPLYWVNLTKLDDPENNISRVIGLSLRDALILNALPCFMISDGAHARYYQQLLKSLAGFPGPSLIISQGVFAEPNADLFRPVFYYHFSNPAFSQRQALWRHALGNLNCPPGLIEALSGQFRLSSGQILAAAQAARCTAQQRGGEVNQKDLYAAARSYSNPLLSNLAHKITPRFTWQDLVLPEDQINLLREIVISVRGRARVFDDWGAGQKLAYSAGLAILFSGQPGTGKTMAAEVIASELGLDLYKIDLSTIVSKYIGETEKNLERIFNEAETSNAILFFDEADALFGKRSEVRDSHDRYANIEISYLLQRMEAYDGITILATNLRANLDEAFTRRLHFAVEFPFPDEPSRVRIWKTLFLPEFPRTEDIDLALLAHRFKLAGGNIRNILISAASLAAADGGQINMQHLLHCTRRELQKMGRLIGDEDFPDR